MTRRPTRSVGRIEQVIPEHAPALLAYFARRVDPPHEAADLLAETLLILWKREASLPEKDDELRPWMFGIARNVLLHHQRSLARRRALAQRLRNELAAVPRPGFSEDPAFDPLHEALQKLDPRDREIIGLLHWDGFSLIEISRILTMKEGTLRSRYHRARERLRIELSSSVARSGAHPVSNGGSRAT